MVFVALRKEACVFEEWCAVPNDAVCFACALAAAEFQLELGGKEPNDIQGTAFLLKCDGDICNHLCSNDVLSYGTPMLADTGEHPWRPSVRTSTGDVPIAVEPA